MSSFKYLKWYYRSFISLFSMGALCLFIGIYGLIEFSSHFKNSPAPQIQSLQKIKSDILKLKNDANDDFQMWKIQNSIATKIRVFTPIQSPEKKWTDTEIESLLVLSSELQRAKFEEFTQWQNSIFNSFKITLLGGLGVFLFSILIPIILGRKFLIKLENYRKSFTEDLKQFSSEWMASNSMFQSGQYSKEIYITQFIILFFERILVRMDSPAFLGLSDVLNEVRKSLKERPSSKTAA